MENKLKEYNVFGEYAKSILPYWDKKANRHKIEPILVNFPPKAKICLILNHLSGHDRMGKTPYHATVPYN
jgi:hypothetical protein